MSEDKKTLWLLDAFALIYRAYFAFSQNQMINSKGLNTSAIYGFTTTLYEVLSNHNPSHIAVVFDTSAPTERHIEFPEYKANRDEMPDDIRQAIPFIKQVIEGFNIPILFSDGYEADDVIGTLAKKAEKEGYTTYMMTPDKDFGQLVSENIFMYRPARMGNKAEVWGIPEICARFEIEDPLQVIDYLGMCGDAVDNIPGIPGVGDKTAKKFLKQYGSMEGLLERSHELKGKMKEKVEANKELALLSKKLATIIIDAPVDFDPKSLHRDPLDKKKLEAVFAEVEFRTLAKRILGEEIQISTQPRGGQMDLFSAPAAGNSPAKEDAKAEEILSFKSIEDNPHQYHLVEKEADLKKLIQELKASPSICFDTETTGLNPLTAELVGIAFCIKKGEAYYVPIAEDQLKAKEQAKAFQAIFEDEQKEIIAQNLKYDLAILKRYDLRLKGRFFDTMIAHYLCEPDQKHNMDVLAENYLGYRTVSIESLIGKKGKDQKTMRSVDPAEVAEYAGEDADITFQLKEIFEKELEKNNMRELFDSIEMPLISVLADMEHEGINLDTDVLGRFSISLGEDIAVLEKEILTLAGTTFNIDSPKQLGEILFDVLKIDDKAKKTKTGQYSTSEDTLSKLADKHEIIPKVLEYRSLKKLKSTYVDSLPELVQETGRIHTSYMQTVAATGRLSSNNPNLQNIPIRTEKGREIRKAFIPKDDKHLLLAADYSQIELRIIAALSEDESMIEAFKRGDDIHAATAAKVFEVPLEEVDRDMRSKAKMVNFGIIYGISAFGLSQRLGIKRGEAKEIIDSYFDKYPKIKSYMDSSIEFARKEGYVETIMKRRRYLKDINGRNAVMRGFAERNAINAPIQGSAADIIKRAMIDIQEEFRHKKLKSKLLLQVHDELVFDAEKSELEEIKKIVKNKMENAVTLSVPLVVEMDAAANWLEAH